MHRRITILVCTSLISSTLCLSQNSPEQVSSLDSLKRVQQVRPLPSLKLDSLPSFATHYPIQKTRTQGKGLQLQLSGTVELSPLLKHTYTENPSLSLSDKRQQSFQLNPDIHLRVDAQLGRKLSLHTAYNSDKLGEDFKRNLRIDYKGDSSELIQNITIGQFAFSPQNSLMGASRQMTGILADLKHKNWSLKLFANQDSKASSLSPIGRTSRTTRQQFSLRSSQYDARRHFFLSNFFKERYDTALAQRPNIATGVRILRLEVWVTRRNGNREQARHALAWSDLGEKTNIHSNQISALADAPPTPDNRTNSIPEITSPLLSQSIVEIGEGLSNRFRRGLDYDAFEYMQRLDPSEYVLNRELGYISLAQKLKEGESLAVSYEYSYGGQIYHVGELSADSPESRPLMLRLLYGRQDSPNAPYWSNMMRNVYAIAPPSRGISDLRLNLSYLAEGQSKALPYINEGKLKGKRLSEVLDVDKLDVGGAEQADGAFDLIEGMTYDAQHGWIYLPSSAPFDAPIARKGGEDKLRYPELYTLSQEAAQALSHKDKYLIEGSYILAQQDAPAEADYAREQEHRQTLLGLELLYRPLPSMTLGLSLMHLWEQSQSKRTLLGMEPMKNTLWALHLDWQTPLTWLDKELKHLFPHLTQTSSLRLKGEWAYLISDYQRGDNYKGYSILDDFDDSYRAFDLLQTEAWKLASVPHRTASRESQTDLMAHRAHLSWFTIDPALLRPEEGRQPNYIRGNADMLSSHYVREIPTHELYPDKELNLSRTNYIPTLNLRFYPNERGQYNILTQHLNNQGALNEPTQSWAGLQRAIPVTDFEAQNVEYLEFWLMSPFLEGKKQGKGELIIQLGDLSEDLLPDGRKSMEQALPSSGIANNQVETSPWGRVATTTPMGFYFSGSLSDIMRQDLGYDGLSSDEERQYGQYQAYTQSLKQILTPAQLSKWQIDEHSPLNDPAGDDFRHYLDAYYDHEQTPILERYKYYNGVEGNSRNPQLRSTTKPDSEDINEDNTLSTDERYYEYRIPLDDEQGQNYKINTRTTERTLPNGTTSAVTWTQYRIPIRAYQNAVGGISGFKSMRFMRLIVEGCEAVTNLRFADMNLMQGSWRMYDLPLEGSTNGGTLSAGVVNIEEHSTRKPINYVLPPEHDRPRTHATLEQRQDNEQSLSLKVEGLPAKGAKAIYKQGNYDLRPYGHLSMYAHAEPIEANDLADDDMTLFLRLGSDLTHNYYEYSLPLKLSPAGYYSNTSLADRQIVWPKANNIDLDLTLLPLLKQERRQAGADAQGKLYTKAHPSQTGHHYSVMGNPSLAHIRNMMIGLRNNRGEERSIEVWVDELRLSEAQKQGDYALNGQIALNVSSLGQTLISMSHRGAGFGAIDERIDIGTSSQTDRLLIQGNLDVGQLLSPKVKAVIPITYRHEQGTTSPRYNPLDDDILVTQSREDVRKQTDTHYKQTSIELTGLNIGIQSQKPMPYDPANLRLDYSYYNELQSSPTIQQKERTSWQLNINYNYSPAQKRIRPFQDHKETQFWGKYLKNYVLDLWPRTISLQSWLTRTSEAEQLRSITDEQILPSLNNRFDDFMWKRKFSITYQPLPELSLTFHSGTDARIEAPQEWLDKQLNPDAEHVWQTAIQRNLLHMGNPHRYAQTATATYTLPTSYFNALSWLSGSLSYTGSYEWQRGTYTQRVQSHTISSQQQKQLALQFNFARLYKLLDWDKKHKWAQALKDINISLQRTNNLYLPGYLGNIGNAFGQSQIGGQLRPGLPFAFGLSNQTFIERSLSEGLFSKDPERAYSGLWTTHESLDVRMSLQALKGLSLTLLMNHSNSQREEYLYSAPSTAPTLRGGDMQMTTIGLSGLWQTYGASADEGQEILEAFRKQQQYVYSELKGQLERSAPQLTEQLNINNPAVLLPAFRRSFMLSSYGLQSIPHSLLAMLPNWNITYTLREQWPFIKKYMNNLTLRHTYRGIYRTNNYDERIGWARIAGTNLATEQGQAGTRVSILEDISSVSLTETFFPLLGADFNFKSGLTLSSQWRRARGLSLGLSTARLIQSLNNEWSLALGYHIKDIRQLWQPAKTKGSNNHGLRLKADWSWGTTYSRIYMLGNGLSQLNLGNTTKRLNLSADYELNKYISLRGFFEWQSDEPLTTGLVYPSVVRTYGLSIKLSLDNLTRAFK